MIRDALRAIGAQYGLVDGDIESTGMGQSGVDILLSPAARKVFPLDVEAKNCEKLNVSTTFFDHHKKYADRPTTKLLVHAKNRTPALVTLLWDDFLSLLKDSLRLKERESN